MKKSKYLISQEQDIRADERRRINEFLASTTQRWNESAAEKMELSSGEVDVRVLIAHAPDFDDPEHAICGFSLNKTIKVDGVSLRESIGSEVEEPVYFCVDCADGIWAAYNRAAEVANRMSERLASILDLADPRSDDPTTD